MTAIPEARCEHDMLVLDGKPTCATCLGQPDVPEIDDPVGHGLAFIQHSQRVRIGSGCDRCGEPIRDGDKLGWSSAAAGFVGECCAEAAS